MKLSIVIPAKNEELSLPMTIENLHAKLSEAHIDFNILVVNDYSDDNTQGILEQMGDQFYQLNVVNNQLPRGVGNAIRFGLDNFDGDIVAICMADASDSPDDIITSYNKIVHNNYDCVFGSRFIKGAKVINYPRRKLFLNRIFNLLVKALSFNHYNDFTNIFKVYHRRVIKGIAPIESDGFSIGLEMSLKSFKKKYKIAIIPISWIQRVAGDSKLKIAKNINVYFKTLRQNL